MKQAQNHQQTIDLNDEQTRKKSYRWLMQRSRPLRGWLSLSICLGLFSGILFILQAALLAYIISAAFIHHFTRPQLLLPLFGLLSVMLIRASIAWVREIVSFQTSARLREDLRLELLNHIKRLGPVHCGQKSSAELATIAIEQVEALENFFAYYLPQMALVIVLPLIILMAIFPISWLAGLILFITAPLIPLFMALIGMGVEALNQRHFQSLARMSVHFLDVLQGITSLKLLNKAKAELGVVASISDNYRRKTMSVLRVAFLSSAVLELFSSLSIALLAVILGLSLLGYIHLGFYGRHALLQSALFILLLAPEFYLPLRELGKHYHARAEAIAAAHEITKILSLAPIRYPKKPIAFTRSDPFSVVFDDVSFCYANKKLVVNHLSLTVNAGEYIYIVGESGSGKSTLLNLLLRFALPTEGHIVIDGVDLADISPDDWFAHVAWIGQNPQLFYGSLRENILLAKPSASKQELQQALRLAQVEEFSSELPNGLNTMIGENKFGLSGGQAQRVALARAYLKQAPLLLLDEPTANLDPVSARLVWQGIQRLAKTATVIAVTHDLENINPKRRVIELENQ